MRLGVRAVQTNTRPRAQACTSPRSCPTAAVSTRSSRRARPRVCSTPWWCSRTAPGSDATPPLSRELETRTSGYIAGYMARAWRPPQGLPGALRPRVPPPNTQNNCAPLICQVVHGVALPGQRRYELRPGSIHSDIPNLKLKRNRERNRMAAPREEVSSVRHGAQCASRITAHTNTKKDAPNRNRDSCPHGFFVINVCFLKNQASTMRWPQRAASLRTRAARGCACWRALMRPQPCTTRARGLGRGQGAGGQGDGDRG